MKPEKQASLLELRAASKPGKPGSYTMDQWIALCNKYGNRCIGPGPHKGVLTPDHVVPISGGGSFLIDNIQPLCRSCNSRKGTASTDYRENPYPIDPNPEHDSQGYTTGISRGYETYVSMKVLTTSLKELKFAAAMSGETMSEMASRLFIAEYERQKKKGSMDTAVTKETEK